MKILVIWRLLTVGGVNAGWRNRAIFFKKHGIETEFLYIKDHGGLHIMEDVARVYLTKDKNKIYNIIQSNNYDAIIVVDTGSAFKWIRKAGFTGPVIVEARTPELKKLLPHVKDFRGIIPQAIVVPSLYQKRLVSIVTDQIPIHIIYNGVDTSFYRAIPKEDINMNDLPAMPENKKIIGWIGRLDNRKNWQSLIQIAKIIKQLRDDIEIWVIGGAQSIQREEFAECWRTENLTDIIKWYPVIPYQQMPHVYSKIRESGGITIATTKTESFGNTFIESMICGVPVVTSKMMPMTELIKNGHTGFLFEQNKLDHAVKQIFRIINNPALHKKLSENAIKHAQKHFPIEKVAKQYVDLLKSLIPSSENISDEVNLDDPANTVP